MNVEEVVLSVIYLPIQNKTSSRNWTKDNNYFMILETGFEFSFLKLAFDFIVFFPCEDAAGFSRRERERRLNFLFFYGGQHVLI